MTLRLSLACVAAVPICASAQHAAPLATAFLQNAREVGENIVLAAEAMPADRYGFSAAPRQPTFGALVSKLVFSNHYFCAALRDTETTPAQARVADTLAKEALVARLRASFVYCDSVLVGLDDNNLGAPVDGGTVTTHAGAMLWLTALRAEVYSQLALALRLNGRVPPRPCTISVNGGCDSGALVCKTTVRRAVQATLTLSDASYSIRSDNRGPYANDNSADTRVLINQVGALKFGQPSPTATQPLRAVTIDLDHPVPGDIGKPRGIIRATANLELGAQWYTESDFTQHSLADIPVGSTVKASQIDVAFHIDGKAHALQMGPQPIGHCYADGSAVYGDGTTTGTITRPTATQWIVDLPVGSVGRLFDSHLREPNAVNLGLYYVSLHFVIDQKQ